MTVASSVGGPGRESGGFWSGWKPWAAMGVAFAAGAFGIWYTHRLADGPLGDEGPPSHTVVPAPKAKPFLVPPSPPPFERLVAAPATPGQVLQSVSVVDENGTRVVKIRVQADGDELIVNAQTGRLIEVRPGKKSL